MIANKLQNEILGWGALGVIIVLLSIVLNKFKVNNVGNMTCSGSTPFYNTSSDICCVASGNCGGANASSIGAVASTSDSFIAALDEPENWVVIVIVAMVGFAVLYLFTKKNK